MKIKDIVKLRTLSAIEEISNLHAALNTALYTSAATAQLAQQMKEISNPPATLDKALHTSVAMAQLAQQMKEISDPRAALDKALHTSVATAQLAQQMKEISNPPATLNTALHTSVATAQLAQQMKEISNPPATLNTALHTSVATAQLAQQMKEISNPPATLNTALHTSVATAQLAQQMQEISNPHATLNTALHTSVATAQLAQQMKEISNLHATLNKALYSSFVPYSKALSELRGPLPEFFEQIQKPAFQQQEAMRPFYKIQEFIDCFKINDAFRSIPDAINDPAQRYNVKLRLYAEYWLISDTDLLLEVNKNSDLEGDFVTEFVVNYYKKENWKRLGGLIRSWRGSISQERLDIFNSALTHTQASSCSNVHLLTIPALIPQIDGLLRDLHSTLPKETKKRIEKEITDNLPDDMKGKRLDIRPDQIIGSIAELVDDESAEILQEFIFEELFKPSNDIANDGGRSLYRHKIMHGNKIFLNYGKEDDFVRLMLYAHFIVNLINQVKSGSSKKSVA